MHRSDGLFHDFNLPVVEKDGLRQLKFDDSPGDSVLSGDAGEVVQKAGGSEVLAGEIHGDREHFPAIPFQTGKRGADPGEHIAV